jgi:hypothetical protein
MTEKKTWWCEGCEEFPDLVEETVPTIVSRRWNGEEYEGVENWNDEPISTRCGICFSELVEREVEREVEGEKVEEQRVAE